MKRTIHALAIAAAALALALLALAGCATRIAESQGELPTAAYEASFFEVADADMPQGAVRVVAEMERRAEQQEQAEPETEPEYYEPYYEAAYYEPYDNGDGFSWQGVREYNGRTETYYSSRVAYHHRTGEWTVDDEGYYRTDEGYYVVAASDMPEGTVFEGSKGECIVLDGGCDEGVTDYYVSF